MIGKDFGHEFEMFSKPFLERTRKAVALPFKDYYQCKNCGIVVFFIQNGAEKGFHISRYNEGANIPYRKWFNPFARKLNITCNDVMVKEIIT